MLQFKTFSISEEEINPCLRIKIFLSVRSTIVDSTPTELCPPSESKVFYYLVHHKHL